MFAMKEKHIYHIKKTLKVSLEQLNVLQNSICNNTSQNISSILLRSFTQVYKNKYVFKKS